MPSQDALDNSRRIESEYVLVRESDGGLMPEVSPGAMYVVMRHKETGKLYWGYRYSWGYGQLEPCRWITE